VSQAKHQRHGKRRAAAVACIIATPFVAGFWIGCSTDSPSGLPSPPDPGGTFGAEILVNVEGGGRVTSAPFALDCPRACFQKFLFNPGGAAPSVSLTAEPTQNWKFAGWRFNKTTSGTRGRGSDTCQPLTRATNDAPGGVDLASPTIALAPGETQGTPPKGKEGECGATGNVPIAYDITATFTPLPPIPDAGPDVGDAGDAGPTDPPLFDAPVAGAKGGRIFVRSSRVYWQWDAAGQSGISMAFTSGGSRTDLVPLGTQITSFNVQTSVVYQNALQTFVSIPLGGGTPFQLPGAPACNAVTADSSYAYCRSGTAIYRWYLFGPTNDGGTPLPLVTGLPAGNDLAVDFTNLYFSDPTAGTVGAIPVAGADGGTPAILSIASGQLMPNEVQLPTSGSTVFWTTYDNGSGTGSVSSASRFGGGIVTSLASKPTVKNFFVDTSAGYVWFTSVPSTGTGASSIWRVSTSGGIATLYRQNLTEIGGIAADTSYVYWTQGDGRVYRALKQ
jgi:hypothetical protein